MSATSEDYFTFDIVTQTITDYDTDGGLDVIIPEQIDNIDVLHIGSNAFFAKGLTSVTLPSELLTIEDGEIDIEDMEQSYSAFGLNEIEDIVIPDNVIYVGIGAFWGQGRLIEQKLLSSITIGESVEEIGDYAFNEGVISELLLSDDLIVVGEYAFADNEIGELIIPDNVEDVGIYAFANNKIAVLDMGSGLEQIDDGVFANNEIEELTIPDNVISIGSNAFSDNDIVEITFNEVMESIGEYAFANNEIDELVIPDSLISIGKYAFDNNNISNIDLGNVSDIGKYAFSNNKIELLTIHDNIASINDGVFCNNLIDELYLGEGLKSIGKNAFENNKIVNLTIPNWVTFIDESAFNLNDIIYAIIPTEVELTAVVDTLGMYNLYDFYIENNYRAGKYSYDVGTEEWSFETRIMVSGTRTSVIDLSSATEVKHSEISWGFIEPDGTSLVIETSLSHDDGETWDSFQEVENDGSIPGIVEDIDLSHSRLKVRITLNTISTNVTPTLHSLNINISGESLVFSRTIWSCGDYNCCFDGDAEKIEFTDGVNTVETDVSWIAGDIVSVKTGRSDGKIFMEVDGGGKIEKDSDMVDSGTTLNVGSNTDGSNNVNAIIADLKVNSDISFIISFNETLSDVPKGQIWLQIGEGVSETQWIWNGIEWERALIGQDDLEKLSHYLRFDPNMGLVIGKEEDPVSITINNEALEFIDTGIGDDISEEFIPNEDTVAYIHGGKMLIDKLEVLSAIIIGRHQIGKYDDRTTFVRWVG